MTDLPVWNRAEAYRADPLEMLRASQRPSWFATLIADFREFFSEVADAPAHHAGFAILILLSVAALFFGPLLVLERVS